MIVGVVFMMLSSQVMAYDVNAAHTGVNQNIDIDKTKGDIWQFLRADGYSEQASAGIMGNLEAESGFNYTATEGHNDWDPGYYLGSHGIGLCQWTSAGRQELLFSNCDAEGVQWPTLHPQLVTLKMEMEGSSWFTSGGVCGTLDDFKKLTDVNAATDIFCFGFERPGVPHIERRYESAQATLAQFAGTAITGSTGGGSENVSVKDASAVISEWDLVGMPDKSGLMADAVKVELPNRANLTSGENYSIAVIKGNILAQKSYMIIDAVRIGIIMVGLLVIVYGVLLFGAYLFDRVNILFDVSLFKVLTLGRLEIADPDIRESRSGGRGYVSPFRLAQIMFMTFFIGFLIVSSGMYSWLINLWYYISELINL